MNIPTVDFDVNGVFVETRVPASDSDISQQALKQPPLLFVHGGCHGSWHWHNFLDYFANTGRVCYALNWYGHYKSRSLPFEEFVSRNLVDVSNEVEQVVNYLGVDPVLIGHSMGGMVCQQYAQRASLKGLVLIASVIPIELGAANIELPAPVDDANLFQPPPFEAAKGLFFQGLGDGQAREEYKLLCAESPQVVRDAVEHRLSVDPKNVTCPVLVLGAELDRLTPEPSMRKLADYYGADYESFRDKGHNLLTVPGWQKVAGIVHNWLRSHSL